MTREEKIKKASLEQLIDSLGSPSIYSAKRTWFLQIERQGYDTKGFAFVEEIQDFGKRGEKLESFLRRFLLNHKEFEIAEAIVEVPLHTFEDLDNLLDDEHDYYKLTLVAKRKGVTFKSVIFANFELTEDVFRGIAKKRYNNFEQALHSALCGQTLIPRKDQDITFFYRVN